MLDDFATTAHLLLQEGPQLLLTGHRGVVPVTRSELLQFADWADEFSTTVRALTLPGEHGFQLDPDVVTILPYQSAAGLGESLELDVEVRNHDRRAGEAEVTLVISEGWVVEPALRRAPVPARGCVSLPFTVRPPRDAERGKRNVVLAEVSLSTRPLGQAAECLVVVT
jgi:hypothetical protein